MTRATVRIWTDGASSGTRLGAGGWAAILCFDDHEEAISGGEPLATNNRMELSAAVEALERLTEPHRVILTTDSWFVSGCFLDKDGVGWWGTWQTNGWRNTRNKPVANRDLWERLLVQNEKHQIEWRHVRGHNLANNPINHLCDQLAGAAKRLAA